MKQRVELHTHTNMQNGVSSAEEYIEEAARQGMSAVAITDAGVVRAFPEAYRAAEKYGIKLIYGMEANFTDDLCVYNDCYHITIIVQNEIGLKNLYRLVTKAHTEHFHKKPLLSRQELTEYHEGLFYGSAGLQGELSSALLEGASEENVAEIANFYDFFEITPMMDEFLINDIIARGNRYQKPVVATCDVHYVFPDDKEAYKIWQWNKGNKNYDKMPDLHLKTTEEMLNDFSYLGKEKAYEIVVEATNRIADLVESFPQIPDEKACPVIENAEEIIRALANDKAKELYGQEKNKIIKERLDWELDAICKNGFATQYLIAKTIADKSESLGYMVGSRGGIGSSFVAYLIGISQINPLPPYYYCPKCNHTEFYENRFCGADMKKKFCPKCKEELKKDGYNIPPEMFMGIDGKREPDIDLNLSEEVREECIKELKKICGDNNVIRAGTIFKIGEKYANAVCGNYCRENNEKYTPETKEKIIASLDNIARGNKQHSGGEMLYAKDKDFLDYTPLQYGWNDPECGYTTHFDCYSLHDKILKFDILCHNDMTMLKRLWDKTGLNPKNIPLDDKKTFDLIANGDADYTEFSNEFVKDNIISVIRPKCMDDLIRISALSHGTGVWTDNAEINICASGIKLSELISCRDDIMIFLIKCGYAREEAYKIAEKVRKGRGLSEEEYQKMTDNPDIPDWYPESCNKILYLFPRAHAATYTLNAYRIAYYKVHYPKIFREIKEML